MNAAQMKCYQYFVANLKELYNKYPDMFVVMPLWKQSEVQELPRQKSVNKPLKATF